MAKRVLSIILCLVTVFSVIFCVDFTASAAAKGTDPYSVGTYPTRDLFYKKGYAVKKGEDVEWVQQVIKNAGISIDVDRSYGPATKKAVKKMQKKLGLEQDGSCGPKTRAALKKWVQNNPKLNGKGNSNANTNININSKITTEQIKAVCDTYGYSNGKYWTTKQTSGGKASATVNKSGYYSNRKNCCDMNSVKSVKSDLYATSNPVTVGKYYKSYNYQNKWECHGFACYVMAKVVKNITGKNNDVNPKSGNVNGWKYINAKDVKELKVGDIVRVSSSSIVHTAIVYSIDSNGSITFLEAGGSARCKIRIGVGFDFSTKYDTLKKIKDKFSLAYVYRYEG